MELRTLLPENLCALDGSLFSANRTSCPEEVTKRKADSHSDGETADDDRSNSGATRSCSTRRAPTHTKSSYSTSSYTGGAACVPGAEETPCVRGQSQLGRVHQPPRPLPP